MKIFELMSDYYESGSSIFFSHINKTEEEFKKDVDNILIIYYQDLFKNQNQYIGVHKIICMISDHLYEFGYSEFKPINYGYWGSGIIRKKEDAPEIYEILGKDKFKELSKVNKNYDNKNKNRIKNFKL